MTSSRQSAYRPAMSGRLLATTAAMLLASSTLSWAEVTVTADPDYPVFPGAFTLDPELFGPAARGIAGDRNLRQTFTNTNTFDVGGLVLSLDINDVAGGLDVELFDVDDVLAHRISLVALHAGGLEVRHVPVDGALGDPELAGQALAGGEAAQAQHLHQPEEAIGTAHWGAPSSCGAQEQSPTGCPAGSVTTASRTSPCRSGPTRSRLPRPRARAMAASRSGTRA